MNVEYQKRRDALWEAVKDARLLHAVKPEGAFYLWARIDDAWPGHEGKRSGWAMTDHLIERAGVGSAPGEVFRAAGAGHVRFAYSCATDQVLEGARLLRELLS
jgi:aspartate aminotransferase